MGRDSSAPRIKPSDERQSAGNRNSDLRQMVFHETNTSRGFMLRILTGSFFFFHLIKSESRAKSQMKRHIQSLHEGIAFFEVKKKGKMMFLGFLRQFMNHIYVFVWNNE